MLKHLKKFATLTSIGIICSCGSMSGKLPLKPSIDSCVIIWEVQAAFCINNQTRATYEIPLPETNKYSCFSNEHYSLLLQYVKELELRTPFSVREELRKLRDSKKKLNEIMTEKGFM